MNVKLISYSMASKKLFDSQSDVRTLEGLVAYCARVSNPDNQELNKGSDKLIKYLVKHKHWSPLEMVNVCLEIETTRDIARQIIRHRSFSFQEFSQRYADPLDDLDLSLLRETRLQDPNNRQNSIPNEDASLDDEWYNKQLAVIETAKLTYKWAIENGIAKEQARAVLPEGLTTSRLYMNGTLRSWVHYIELRAGNGTQKEHQDIAVECAKIISGVFPLMESMYV